MSLPNQLVFALLIFYVVVLLILCAPLPQVVRKAVVSFVSKSRVVEQLLFFLKIGMVGVTLMFADTVMRTQKLQETIRLAKQGVPHGDHMHHHLPSADADAVLHSKLFYSQRNMYLTGFTLLLSLVLNRVYSLIKEVVRNDERSAVVVRQADNNAKQLAALVDGKDDAAKEVAALKAKLALTEAAARDLDVVKAQANANNEQYMELADRYTALEAKYKRVAAEHGVPLDAEVEAAGAAIRRRSAASTGKKEE
ncbi:Endoplasmic reticulum transmembrane protein 3 [Blastocladiella emersonii ATCC 22665]|nr:Endoplasmic reticulum transmembrane protein 3 [Blastocladiella emersonii ATCC 22665]